MQKEKECFTCKTTSNLQKHHIFGGSNRKWSEKYGLWVWLDILHHTASPTGVHHNKEFMDHLHKEGQKAFENNHGTREEFIKIFGKNYL